MIRSRTVCRILQLHGKSNKAASEAAAARHIVARVREHQSLQALAQFAGVTPAMFASGDPAQCISRSMSPTDCVQQLELYVQHRIAQARAAGGTG
jgi:hypothetical protein